MSGYTKLFSSIIHSTIWRAENHVRLVWVTMMAMADKDGIVEASVPGLADAARVSIDECQAALIELSSPDPYSRTEDHEGRRIGRTPGGWQLLNHRSYRDRMCAEERRERDAERKRAARAADSPPPSEPVRERPHVSAPVRVSADCPHPSENVRDVSHTEAEADTDSASGSLLPSGSSQPSGSDQDQPVSFSHARARGSRPRPRPVLLAQRVAVRDYVPLPAHGEYALELGLDAAETDRALRDLRDKFGGKAHDEPWLDDRLCAFIEQAAKLKASPRRGPVAGETRAERQTREQLERIAMLELEFEAAGGSR